jgi:hypothetical protein
MPKPSLASRQRSHASAATAPIRAIVGFSSTDTWAFRQMSAWKDHHFIGLDFRECRLQHEICADDEVYIKSVCRERLDAAATYVMLIGEDTRWKHTYVRWEAEVAIEKGCRLIGANLDGVRWMHPPTCPPVLRNRGAVFVPFSPEILGFVLQDFPKQDDGDWHVKAAVYERLGLAVTPAERLVLA